MPELIFNLALLRDKGGRSIAKPSTLPVSISYQSREGVAQAWDAETGKKLVAEMQGVRVDWIGAGGLRLIGMEPIDVAGQKFRLQEWHLSAR